MTTVQKKCAFACAAMVVATGMGMAMATEWANHAVRVPGHPPYGGLPAAPDSWTFDHGAAVEVYTVRDINEHEDAIRKELNSRIEKVSSDISALIQRKVQDSETKLKNEVKGSIDQLPQRLLSDEAKKSVKDAVVQELRDENAQLRQDMQDLRKQIEDLKRSGGR